MRQFTFTMTESEANLILASLGKQPYEAVATLVHKLQAQAQLQLAEPATPVEQPVS